MNCRCCTCRKVKPVYHTNRDTEQRAPAAYRAGYRPRKPAHFCKECWEAVLEVNRKSLERTEQATQKVLREMESRAGA